MDMSAQSHVQRLDKTTKKKNTNPPEDNEAEIAGSKIVRVHT